MEGAASVFVCVNGVCDGEECNHMTSAPPDGHGHKCMGRKLQSAQLQCIINLTSDIT